MDNADNYLRYSSKHLGGVDELWLSCGEQVAVFMLSTRCEKKGHEFHAIVFAFGKNSGPIVLSEMIFSNELYFRTCSNPNMLQTTYCFSKIESTIFKIFEEFLR